MSQQAQEIFNRINELKKKQKDIKSMYRDALTNSGEYQALVDEINGLKDKRKKIEEGIKSQFNSEFDQLDEMKADIESDQILLSDVAINHIMKGEKLEIIDDKQNRYEPVFNVKFKKI